MNQSSPGQPVHRQLPQFTQTHVHQVGDVKDCISHSQSQETPQLATHRKVPWKSEGEGHHLTASEATTHRPLWWNLSWLKDIGTHGMKLR